MANTFLTSSFVLNAAQDAALILSANLVASNLVSRQFEDRLGGGVPTVGPSGGSVVVKVISADTANTQNHRNNPTSLSVSDVTETSVTVDALHYIYVKKKLNTKEKTFELDDFTRKYTMPAMVGIANAVDQFMIRKIAGGFARNLSGTAGTAPSTTAHILAARKVMQDNLVPLAPRVALIGTAAEMNFLGLDQFVNRNYGEDGATSLRQAALSTRYGINWFVDQNVGTFDYGYTTGTLLANGAGSPGGTSISIDGFTASGGTLNEGTRFTVAGDATVYTTTADVDVDSNAVSVGITPAIVTGWADNAAVTLATAYTEDVIFHPGMVAGAIIAPAPMMVNSQVAQYDGLSVRVTFDSTTSDSVGAADFVLFDVYVGCKVIRPEGGVVLQGS